MFHYHKISVIGLILLTCAGCGSDQLRVYPVSGTISFDGKPMQGGGAIAFIPTEGQNGKTAGGVIDDDGNYTLSTYAEGDGSIPGKFRVIVTQAAAEEPEATPDGTAPREPVESLSSDLLIPAIYSDFKASPLTATVEETKQELNFELKRDAGPPPGQPAPPQQVGA
jgi:hypothetical protein